jgi:hypothetical protein
VGCKGTGSKDLPEGWIELKQHPEFDDFRPVAVAVLKVDAPRADTRDELRRGIYEGLFDKRYSAIKLDVVDSHTNSDGGFEGDSLEWDATMRVRLDTWRSLRSGRWIEAGGTATLTHRSGEVLWDCSFGNYPFRVESAAGSTDYQVAVRAIALLFLDRLPDCPPLPAE